MNHRVIPCARFGALSHDQPDALNYCLVAQTSYSTIGWDLVRRKASAWRLPSVADPASLMVIMRQLLSLREFWIMSSGSARLPGMPPNRMTIDDHSCIFTAYVCRVAPDLTQIIRKGLGA